MTPNISDVISATFKSTATVAASFGVGYIYGAVFKANKIVAAQAFAVSAIAFIIFGQLLALSIDAKKDPKAYHTVCLVVGTTLSAIQILAFRELKLIGTLGTAVLGYITVVTALSNLKQCCKS